MQTLDKIKIQRLVDGELSFNETQQLLRDASSQPQSWASIASAFVEDQVWKSEFASGHELTDGNLPNRKRSDSRPVNTRKHVASMKWLALAASVLLTIGIGFLALDKQHSGSPDNANNLLVDNQPAASVPVNRVAGFAQPDVTSDDLNQTPAVYRMKLEDPTGNQFLDSDVPIYSGRQTDVVKWLDNEEVVPVSISRRAAESGYRLQKNVRYLSGRFNDGRQFVIPVRKYSFQPNQ